MDIEKGRSREPVARYRPFLAESAFHPNKEGRERLEVWMVRDRVGDKVEAAGKFEVKEDAEKWIVAQGA